MAVWVLFQPIALVVSPSMLSLVLLLSWYYESLTWSAEYTWYFSYVTRLLTCSCMSILPTFGIFTARKLWSLSTLYVPIGSICLYNHTIHIFIIPLSHFTLGARGFGALPQMESFLTCILYEHQWEETLVPAIFTVLSSKPLPVVLTRKPPGNHPQKDDEAFSRRWCSKDRVCNNDYGEFQDWLPMPEGTAKMSRTK